MAKGVAKENETEILDIRLIKLWQMPHVVGCYEGIVEDYILLPLSKTFRSMVSFEMYISRYVDESMGI